MHSYLWHICEPIYEVRQPSWNRRQFVVILLDWHGILVDPSRSNTVDVSFSSFLSYVYSFISHMWMKVIKKRFSSTNVSRHTVRRDDTRPLCHWIENSSSVDRQHCFSILGQRPGILKHRKTYKEERAFPQCASRCLNGELNSDLITIAEKPRLFTWVPSNVTLSYSR